MKLLQIFFRGLLALFFVLPLNVNADSSSIMPSPSLASPSTPSLTPSLMPTPVLPTQHKQPAFTYPFSLPLTKSAPSRHGGLTSTRNLRSNQALLGTMFLKTILWTLFYQCYRGLQRIGYFLAGLENPNLQLNPSPCDASLTASMLSSKKTVHSIVKI